MHVYFKEARATLALAFPIIVGQVSQMLMGVSDSVMIGRLGTVPLAASAFAGGVFALFFVVGIGLLMPVAVLVARAQGAGSAADVTSCLRHGVVLAALAAGIELGLMLALLPALGHFGQPPEVVAVVGPFYALIALSLAPALLFQVFRQFAEAMGRPWVPMGIMLGGVGLNLLLNWVLIYGRFGLPAMGLTGAGVATLLARVLSLVAVCAWLRGSAALRTAWPAAWFAPVDRARLGEMLRIGLPASVMLLFEAGAFVMSTFMMGWIDATALAAHQIALSCAGFVFMVPLGLSMAVSMRVGQAVGEGRRASLRPIGVGALAMNCFTVVITVPAFTFWGPALARGFVDDAVVVVLAAKMLVVAAIFQLFDGAQVVASGALRGLTDVRVPTVITFVAYWLLVMPGAYVFGVRGPLGAVGVWMALALGLAIAAILLVRRFYKLTA